MPFQEKELNKLIPIPLYFQLKNIILEEIKTERYGVGETIPTDKELSEIFQVSRSTVRQAVVELVNEGWLVRVKGTGTLVSKPKINQDLIKRVESFDNQILRSGMKPSTILLELKIIKANKKMSQKLGIVEGAAVIYMHRKRLANDIPIVVLKTFLPYEKCEFVMHHDLQKERLYSILGNNVETAVYRVERIIEAVEADTEDGELLAIKTGKPIQQFISVGYNVEGNPIEYSIARYRGDKSSFEITVFPND